MVRYPLGGAIRDIQYDAKDRITAYTHLEAFSGAASPAVQALNQSFSYDELGRLTSIGTSVGNWSFTYDDNGNRRTESTSGAMGANSRNYATPSISNRLMGIDNPARTLQHDAAGNTFSDLQGQRGWTAEHNLPGRMSRLNSTPDGVNVYVTDYVCNAAGQRVATVPVSGSCIGTPTCNATQVARQPVVFVYGKDGVLLGEYTRDRRAHPGIHLASRNPAGCRRSHWPRTRDVLHLRRPPEYAADRHRSAWAATLDLAGGAFREQYTGQ